MALFQFSTSLDTTVSDLVEKLTSWQEDGASISDIAVSSVNDIALLINDKYCNITYNMSLSSNANYYWFLCDSLGYETLIILCDSPTVNENGYRTTFGTALYNAIYFLNNGKLIRNPQIDEPICSQFNIPNGSVIENSDDRVIFTKCTFNNGVNIETGSNEITDRLYISTNLVSTGFLTEIAGSGQKFINIGGIFYLPYNNVVLGLSKYKKRSILKNAEIELWAGCYEDNEKIYDRKEENTFYKNIYNNIKMVPDGNMEMGYIDLDAGDRLLLTSKEPFYNKTIYLVAYDVGVGPLQNETGYGATNRGYMHKIITSGTTFKATAGSYKDKIIYYPEMFSLNKLYKNYKDDNDLWVSKEWGYALMNYNNQTTLGSTEYHRGANAFNYTLLSDSNLVYSIYQPTYQDAIWISKDIKPKKNIYVFKTPVIENGKYSAFINNLKMEKSTSYFIDSYGTYSKGDYFLIIGNRQSSFPTEETTFNHNTALNTPELKINYFGIVEESQSDEEIQQNIQHLAKKFKVDLDN